MLTPEIPEGFKPHYGGPCPVPLDSKPAVMFRKGLINGGGRFYAAEYDPCWLRGIVLPQDEIIAYREEPSDAA